MSGSAREKKSLAGPVPPPLMILHAEEDAVEVNVASNPRTDDMLFEMIEAKERELIYQKVVLQGCQDELKALKQQLEEGDPTERELLLQTAQKFALALAGKKEQFIKSYEQWKTSVVHMDLVQAAETRE